jgi:hypothetical protein
MKKYTKHKKEIINMKKRLLLASIIVVVSTILSIFALELNTKVYSDNTTIGERPLAGESLVMEQLNAD